MKINENEWNFKHKISTKEVIQISMFIGGVLGFVYGILSVLIVAIILAAWMVLF